MGIGDWVSSASDKLKQNAPDLTAVTNICRNTCKAVTVDGTERIKVFLPGSEGREKIKRIVTEVAVPEILRYTSIPGAVQAFKIIWENPSSSSVHDRKKYEYMSKELEKMKNELEELKEAVEIIKLDNKILSEQCRRFESQNKASHQQPKVIQNPQEVMMGVLMNGFKCRDLLCHLIIPNPKAGYPKTP